MSKLEQIRAIVEQVYSLDTTPTKAIIKITAVLDSTETETQ